MRHFDIARKITSILANLSLLLNSFLPFVLAIQPVNAQSVEDLSPTPTPAEIVENSPTPTPEIVISETPTPTVEPTVTPEVSPTVIPTISPEATPEATPTNEITPTPENNQSNDNNDNNQNDDSKPVVDITPTLTPIITPTPTPVLNEIEQVCVNDSDTIRNSVELDWNYDATKDIYETREKIQLGVKYVFPQDNNVTVTFKCLPKDEVLRSTLKIKRVKTSDLKLPNIENVSDYAYDITTDMRDGIFKYDITLPKSSDSTAKVSYIEKSLEEATLVAVPESEIKSIENLEQQSDSVKALSIDHFTIYIVTTYSTSSLTILKSSYSQGETIYAKGTSDDIKTLRLVFFDKNNNVVKTCSEVTGTETTCEYTLSSGASIGNWSVQLQRKSGSNWDEKDTLVFSVTAPTITPPVLIDNPSDTYALNSVTGSWTAISGGSGYQGIGTGEIRWGNPSGDQKSGLRFTNSGAQSFNSGNTFYLGMLTHMNWGTYAGTAADGATLQITLNFNRPSIPNPVFTYDFDIEETSNSAGSCRPYQISSTPCDDKITFPTSYGTQVVTIGDIQYTLVIDGFVNAYPSGTAVPAFITEEQRENSAFLVGHLSSVLVERPAISIIKTTNDQDVTSTPGPYLSTGSTVNWKYNIQNIGNVDLTNVTIIDNPAVTINCNGQTTLASGAQMICTASGIVTAGQFSNTATVTGTHSTGTVTASDTSWYFGTTCGDHVIQGSEQCDGGACCDNTCHFASSGSVCRAANGSCDTAEVCSGASAACPTDSFKPVGTSCSDGSFCNGNEQCNGTGSCLSGNFVDCSANNIAGINSCDNDPDNNPFTKDTRDSFNSVCSEATQSCTVGDSTIFHQIPTVGTCGVECNSDSNCLSSEKVCNIGTHQCVNSCGNNIKESWEQCDGSAPEHYSCNGQCKLEYIPYCGDGVINGNEQCDGSNLGSYSSTDFQCNSCSIELINSTVDICHSTSADNNPYIVNHPSKSGDVSGHADDDGPVWYPGITVQWGDIIPPFAYIGGTFPGLNWTADGQAIYNNGCNLPNSTLKIVKIVNNAGGGIKSATDFKFSLNGAAYTNFGIGGSNTYTLKIGDTYSVIESPEFSSSYSVSSNNCSGVIGFTEQVCTITNNYTPKCGDGITNISEGEQCDDGNTDNTDSCTNSCKSATCGDHIIWAGHETCDDGADNNTTCSTTYGSVGSCSYCDATLCTIKTINNPRCGDGIVDSAFGEECDDANSTNTDSCTNSCRNATCGDGFLQFGEQCDDGNSNNNDNCSSTCQIEYGSVKIIKNVIPDNSSVWDFTLNGSKGNFSVNDLGDGQSYTINNILPGGYNLSEITSSDYSTQVTCDGNGPFNQSGYLLTVTPNNTNVCTFTNTKLSSIQGRKFNDINGNGVFDESEKDDVNRLNNWVIELYKDSLNSTAVASVVTGSNGLAKGQYRFEKLLPGQYYVCEVGQTGWAQTAPSVSTGVYHNGNYCHSIILTAGQSLNSIHFGNFQLGSISGQKFKDLNNNGVKDIGEPGLENWTINLDKDADGNVDTSTTTDSSGNYQFTNLVAGTYQVREVNQNGWFQTTTNPTDITINSGSRITNIDFGNLAYASITVDKITNPSGDSKSFAFSLQRSGDQPVEFNLADQDIPYINSQLIPGTYSLSETLPDNWVAVSQICTRNGDTIRTPLSSLQINTGDVISCVFTNAKLSTVTITKDAHPNSSQDFQFNGGDLGTFYLDDDDDATLSNTKIFTVVPGHYTFDEVLPSGWKAGDISCNGQGDISNGETHIGGASFDIGYNSTYTCTFNNYKQGSIEGYKYNDANKNGTFDSSTEESIKSWTINLYQDLMSDGDSDPVPFKTITTDSTGKYKFTNLDQDNYYVCESSQNNWVQTQPSTGTQLNGLYCYQLDLTNGQDLTNNNFGNYQKPKITIYKFNDLNGNGVKDEGESYMSDWQINIADKGTQNYQQMTNVLGLTEFNLMPGEYTLSETMQNGWKQTGMYCDDQSGGVLITAPNEAYGHHGACSGWNACGDAATCALWACESKGYTNLVSYGVSKKCPEFGKCNLFYSRGSVQTDWGNGAGWCTNIMGVTDIVCSNGTGSGSGSYRSSGNILNLSPNQVKTCYIGNQRLEPKTTITKSNNSNGVELSPGSSVEYTINIGFSDNSVNNLKVTDLLSNGIKYRTGSYQVWLNGNNVTESLNLPAPSYNSPGSWDLTNLGKLNPGNTVELKYIADISTNQQAGKYADLAWSVADNFYQPSKPPVYALALEDDSKVDTNFVGTEVRVGGNYQNSVSAEVQQTNHTTGEVLGASTELPGTGAATIWMIVSGLLGLVGFSLLKFNKKTMLTILLTLLSFGLIISPVRAQASNLSVRLEEPKTPSRIKEIELKYVALDIQGREVTTYCLKKGPSDSNFIQFSSETLKTGGNASHCSLVSAITDNGSYQFQVKAVAGGEESYSNTVSLDYNTSSPGTPRDYSKQQINSCDFKIHFKTADDSGKTVKVELYRSTDSNFSANNESLVHSINIGSNQEADILNNVPDCSKIYYFALRAFDNAGNGSGLVGDKVYTTVTDGTTTVTSTTTNSGAIPVSGTVIPKEGEENQVNPDISSEEGTGQVLGVRTVVKDFFARHPVTTILIAVLILGIIIYAFKRIKKAKKNVKFK